MESREFEKIWNLYRVLYPGHRNLDDENQKIVWEVALRPFSLDDVVAAVMAWSRKKKYFPAIAEITGGLTEIEEPPEKPDVHQSNPYFDTAWAAPYIRKLAASVSEHDADKLHAAGLQTWTEAENAGMSFPDWNRAYRRIFPAVKGTVHGGEQAVGA